MYITKYYKVQSKMGKMIKINQRDKSFKVMRKSD